MDPSLSVILPVHNAQMRLVERVDTLLEIVPDLTSCFDLMIVDDGSTDQTVELAHELARRYPQVRVLRHPLQHGPTVAVEMGLRQSTGQIVFVQDDHLPISPSRLRRLFRTRLDEPPALPPQARLDQGATDGMIHSLVTWATAFSDQQSTSAHVRGDV